MKPIHILYADDDPDDQELLRESLEESEVDFLLKTVDDGAELIKQLATINSPPPPHLILLDINMPRKNGIECLVAIRKIARLELIPIIMFTTSIGLTDIDQSFKYGANRYLPKDFFISNSKVIIEKIFVGSLKNILLSVSRDRFVISETSLFIA
ncbi:MAG: response regulator [Chitinophagaceae bacterium]